MFGWRSRTLFSVTPFFLPQGVAPAAGRKHGPKDVAGPLVCLLATFALATSLRFLELPFWDNPAYVFGNEFLLATHDAYHWIAGAEGFEFGAGHPMSELIRLVAEVLHISPARAGFWLPPFFGGILAVAVFLWGWGLGQPYAGMCAGILASLAPAFFARTLFGFCDTDLIDLLFAVLLGLIPALWLSPWLAGPLDVLAPRLMRRLAARYAATRQFDDATEHQIGNTAVNALEGERPWVPLLYGTHEPGLFGLSPEAMERSALSVPWLLLLILSGLFGWQTQFWHSLFPYLIRYCALLPGLLIFLLGPRGGRSILLRGAVCHALPLLAGIPGAIAAGVYAAILIGQQKSGRAIFRIPAQSSILLAALWALVLYCALDFTVFTHMLRSFASYADRSGHVGSVVPDPVVFPSVERSIIEVQLVSLTELLIYNHPLELLTLAAFGIALWRMLVAPAFLWLFPLLILCLLGLHMGARMTMFGSPVLMLALCLAGGNLLNALLHSLRLRLLRKYKQRAHDACCPHDRIEKAARQLLRLGPPLRFAASLICTAFLAWPLITPLPDYVQGPIISREQAEGLSFLKNNSPEESMIWNWWDWGYAVHHFSRRYAIADGARHGGPSLYLPAAVYTTADPRFARQIIKYTALKENVPGKVFAGLSATEAQDLMRELGDKKKPLIKAEGTQYLVVSMDLLRLGLWITRFGSWNFTTQQGQGALLNNLSPALLFNPDTGEVMSDDSRPILAAGITLFDSGGLEQYRYDRPDGYYFLFNIQKDERGSESDMLRRFWTWQRGRNPFPGVISDKLVMDRVFFNTMMVQLLICPENDPAIAPYFKLVFDNTYTRVYEVL